MTETQATSGAGTSTNPLDNETDTEGSSAAGRSVGRATVPGESPAGTDKGSSPSGKGPSSGAEGSSSDSGAGSSPDSKQAKQGRSAGTAGRSPGLPGGQAGSSGSGIQAGSAGSGITGATGPTSGAGPTSGGITGGVPTTSGSAAGGGTSGGSRFTRAPGMTPPPDRPPAPGTPDAERSRATVSLGSSPLGSASTVPIGAGGGAVAVAPVSAPPTTGDPGATGTQSGRSIAGAGNRPVGAARVSDAVRAARATSTAAASRGPRRARLTVKRVDPWSVMKFSFAVSLVLLIVTIVATSVLYLALDAMGVFDSVNASLGDLLTSASSGNSDGGGSFKITAKGIIGTAGLLGAVNVVLLTALATLGAFIYNVCADLVGGVELTLSERD